MTRQLRDVGNDGNPNKVGDFNLAVGMGDAIKLGAMSTRRAVVNNKISLGDGFRVARIVSAYSAEGAVTGALTAVANGATPATGEVAVDLQGNVEFAVVDAITLAEVTVELLEGNTIDLTTSADATGKVSFLQGDTAQLLIVCEQLSGAALGAKAIVARGAAPAAGQVSINADGSIQFNAEAADAQVRVKFVSYPKPSVLDKLAEVVAF